MSSNRLPHRKGLSRMPSSAPGRPIEALLDQYEYQRTQRLQKARASLSVCRQALRAYQALGHQRFWVLELNRYAFWLSQYINQTEED